MAYQGTVTNQPEISSLGVYGVMAFPGQIPGVPAGLEYMSAVDQLIIKQELSLIELTMGIEGKNNYRVFNSLNQQAYMALEESDFCNRMCCGSQRGFIFHIVDNNQQEVMTITRDFKCCAGCSLCADGLCMYPMHVRDRNGQTLGMTRQLNYCCVPHMGIFDASDQLLFEITGPCCPCQTVCCRDDVDYPIMSAGKGSQVGMIKKIWSGVLRECFTDTETFSVQFPLDLDVKHKALMFAAVFLIDFTIFEIQKKNNK